MNNKTILLIASIMVAVNPVCPKAIADDGQPNIVILFSDDAGYADFGFQPDV